MMRLLSSKAQGRKDFWKPSKPCHVDIHWIALAEFSQMSTNMLGFQSFFSFFASFCFGHISHQQHKSWSIPHGSISKRAWPYLNRRLVSIERVREFHAASSTVLDVPDLHCFVHATSGQISVVTVRLQTHYAARVRRHSTDVLPAWQGVVVTQPTTVTATTNHTDGYQ